MVSEVTNLADQMLRQLPAELVEFMRVAGQAASKKGQSLYLVGGVVRDLLLKRTNLDLDLVVEGDAIGLAKQLAESVKGKILTHTRFGTAKLKWDSWSVDFATARSETYERPGALPSVSPGSLDDDLFRRDFTINAMAVELIPKCFGKLVDLYGGMSDLKRKLIRILHERSFIDDATRIWRGLRYEQRLGFQLEADTLRLLKRDIPMLDAISGDRIRHELELVLREAEPEKVILRAEELGVLAKLHPSLKGDSWLEEKFREARKLKTLPSVELYISLITYRLTIEEKDELISHLKLNKTAAQVLRDTSSLKSKLDVLSMPEAKPSSTYQLLSDSTPEAITAIFLVTDSPVVRQRIRLFLNKLRYIRPALTGNDLLKMGIAQGPKVKEVLAHLHKARLDGEVTSKKEEEALVREWVEKAE
ncbi:MAG: CCA tRNA nucleotidyltransferase [Chloroflexota bacterium]